MSIIKEKHLNMEKTIERTTNDGKRYMFIEHFPHFISTYAWYNDKFNHISKNFHSFEEVDEFIKNLNKPVIISAAPLVIPDNYYGVRGRYYGD